MDVSSHGEEGDHAKNHDHWDDKGSDLALVACDRALLVDPSNPDAWNAKGQVLLRMGRITDASECFAKATRLYLGQEDPAPG